MALIACACITAGAAINIARDGGPPRERTRAEVSPPSPAPARASVATPADNDTTWPSSNVPAPTLEEFEQRLAAADAGSRELVLRETLPAMVAVNPDLIARYAELQASPQLREQLVRQVAQLWAKSDVERAMAWVTSLPESPERQATLIDVSITVAETDPQRAVDLREPAVGNIEPDGVLDTLVQRWAEKDFDAAMEWTSARPRGAQHDKLLQRLVYVRAAGGAPVEAARMVDESFDDGASKAEAAAIVARQWSQTDPGAANAWLTGLDAETARQAMEALR